MWYLNLNAARIYFKIILGTFYIGNTITACSLNKQLKYAFHQFIVKRTYI